MFNGYSSVIDVDNYFTAGLTELNLSGAQLIQSMSYAPIYFAIEPIKLEVFAYLLRQQCLMVIYLLGGGLSYQYFLTY